MAVVTKKRYRIVGDFTMRARDGEGLEHHFVSGDVLPDELAASLNKAELDSMLSIGKLVELGAKPAPRPAPEPVRPPTVAETLRGAGWWDASVEDGQVVNGPRGYRLTVIDKPAREADLRRVLEVGGEPVITIHQIDGAAVATVTLAQLAQLLATQAAQRLVR